MINLTIYLPKRDSFLRVPHGDLYIHYFLYFCNSKHLEVNIDRGLLGPQPTRLLNPNFMHNISTLSGHTYL